MKKRQLKEWVHQLVEESNIEVVKEIQLGETTVRLGKATDASFHKQGGSMIVQLISYVGSVGLDKRDVRALIGYIKKMMGYSYMPRLKEGFDLKKLEDAIKMFQKKIKKQGRVTNARDEEHLEKLIKVYKEMGGKKIKEGKLKENRKQIAQTILQQLGGNKFIAMTGAKNLGFDSKGSKTTLSFKIGRNAKSINYVKVDYISGKDLYDMSFFRLRAGQLKLIKKVSSIYGDQLQKFFTKNTGLYTRL